MICPRCFFAVQPGAGPCEGHLIRAHLVPQQLLRREGHAKACDDPRSWVPCCGGPVGLGGHHGRFDGHQLPLPRYRLPQGFVDLMDELGLGWYVDRRYGPNPDTV